MDLWINILGKLMSDPFASFLERVQLVKLGPSELSW